MRNWGLILMVLMMNVVCANEYPVHLGNKCVVIQKLENGPGKSFIHLHHNETTALRAAKHIVETEGGTVLTLIHSGKRNIVFYLNHDRYEFDPNRMFTDIGIKQSLRTFGHYSLAAHTEVKRLADRLKSLLPKGKIIAVHNNNDYSIKEYFPGKSLHRDAQALHLDAQRYYRNFYLVTRPDDFHRLKELRYNTVLQAQSATDDGSLSVYLASRDYVNVEAGYRQLQAQIDMLKWA